VADQLYHRRYASLLAASLMGAGTDVVTGGTDTPLVVADPRSAGLRGQPLVESLDRAGITCNRCEIPFDDVDPAETSGLRFGLSACTTRGLGIDGVTTVGGWINQIIAAHARHDRNLPDLEADIRLRASGLMTPLPLYPEATAAVSRSVT